jgi:ribosomal protein S18 acetylase RimI-like enzyme
MTEADLPAACALWSTAEGVELAEGDSLPELAAYLRRNPGASQVALQGDQLVGAVLAGHDGRRGIIYHLAVAPTARRHGLGRALVERSLAVLRAGGMRRVLILVARDNPAGREFWIRSGWEPLEFAEPMGRDI